MSNKKSLSCLFLSSCLVSSLLVPQVSGMEVVCKQQISLKFKSLDDYILSREDNKRPVSETEFINIMISVCEFILNELKQERPCNYVSSQSIKVCSKGDSIIVKIEKSENSKQKKFGFYEPSFWIISMMRHFTGNKYLSNSNYEQYPLDSQTFRIFEDFKKIEGLLNEIDNYSKNTVPTIAFLYSKLKKLVPKPFSICYNKVKK